MTHEEGVAWLSSESGGLKTQMRDGVVYVVAFAHNLAASIPANDLSDAADVLKCELEAIEELQQIPQP